MMENKYVCKHNKKINMRDKYNNKENELKMLWLTKT